MSDQMLRDKNLNLIARLKTNLDGTIEIRDKNMNFLGKYDPRTNETRDKNGMRVGIGNLLTTLI